MQTRPQVDLAFQMVRFSLLVIGLPSTASRNCGGSSRSGGCLRDPGMAQLDLETARDIGRFVEVSPEAVDDMRSWDAVPRAST